MSAIFVEVLKDVSLRVAPLTRSGAINMIKEVKAYKILQAFRGRAEAGIKGIVDVLLKLSRLAMDLHDVISEIDINPLMVGDRGKG